MAGKIILVLLLAANICKGQTVDTATVHIVCAYHDGRFTKQEPPLDQTHYGVIEFMPDSSKICFKLVIDGYVVTNLFKPNHYYDNRGKELFRQRFARGKFLNFYKD